MQFALLFLMLVLGAAVAMLIGVRAERLGMALGLMDHPDLPGGRKRHARATPLIGGMAIVAATLLATALTRLALPLLPADRLHLAWLAAATAGMWLIGAIDDRLHLSPLLRLGSAAAVLGTAVSVAGGFHLSVLAFPSLALTLALGPWSFAFTLLCAVGLLNAVNMADGKNGIVVGMALIWTMILAGHAGPALLPLLVALGAALAVTFGFNMAGRLFLGDGGSYAVSALYGLLAIYSYNRGALGAGDVALLFAVPVFDTIRLMLVRPARGRSPLAGDRDHLHHHLHDRLGWPQGLAVYLAMVGGPNLAALLWPGTGLAWLCLTALAYAAAMAWLRAPAPQLAE